MSFLNYRDSGARFLAIEIPAGGLRNSLAFASDQSDGCNDRESGKGETIHVGIHNRLRQ
jgi:hypothetical protein